MEKKIWYKNNWLIAIAAIVLLFIIGRGCNQDTNSQTSQNKTQPSIDTQKQASESKTEIPEYEIVHSLEDARFDKGDKYYVLIPEVDLSNDNFKKDVKIIIKSITEEKGNKISIEIFDTKKALELLYSQYGDMSLERPRTETENEMLAVHSIAGFSGELTTDIYLNTLYFFPSAFSDDKKVGKYVETIEFDPKDYNP